MNLGELVPGTLVERSQRFVARVEVAGTAVEAHVPNSGRLAELMLPGTAVLLRRDPGRARRRTGCDLVLVDHGGGWTCVDTRLPPHLVVEAIRRGVLREFPPTAVVEREVRLGGSRLDLRVAYDQMTGYVETKSVTLVQDGRAMFPDAPTARGTRHLAELARSVAPGIRGVVVFVVQRPDAVTFAPHEVMDPHFAAGLRTARGRGVEVLCYRCETTPSSIAIGKRLPVHLG